MRTSAFEILGPVMVGPSSSHTAGALRIALVARSLAPRGLSRVDFALYNSFAHTYKGHGTDRALVAGMLGLSPDDERVRDSFALADEAGLSYSFTCAPDEDGIGRHPNTVTCAMWGADDESMSVTGESLGGGRIRICQVNGIGVEMTGDYPTLFMPHEDHPGVLASITGTFADTGVNIAAINTFRKERGGMAYAIVELDERVSEDAIARLRKLPMILGVSSVEIPGALTLAPDASLTCDFNTGAELLAACEREGCSIGELMHRRETELSGSGADVDRKMARVLEVMRSETTGPIGQPRLSLGGLIGGQARAVSDAASRLAPSLMGGALTRASAFAMATLERSASMGVIVAAPTAGSSGVVPGAILGVAQETGADEGQVTNALWCAAAIGALLARNASVAGSEGGCQAEVGSAAAMAAAGLVELLGGSASCALSAASTALGNLLGLVCDPVRGLVEYPCQDRNVIGVANAITAAQLALSGALAPIPFDEVVEVTRRVGAALPPALRETALGGLAVAPSAATACSRCAACG